MRFSVKSSTLSLRSGESIQSAPGTHHYLPNVSVHTTQLQAWDLPGTGLLINERLINSPPQLAPPLVQALFSEISWATEDEPTQVGCSSRSRGAEGTEAVAAVAALAG